MRAYYNEIDPYAAQWLQNLIAAGHLPDGDVDTRSIVDVRATDLAGYGQCHFFAGIGGWALAARLSGWPDSRPLWTGSCPCQPYSVAGKGAGADDARHLWPDFFRLIRACRPDVVMGEQVAAAVGKDWLDGVFSDLEGIGYASGAAVVPACAVDAPHRRDRLWFVAHTEHGGRQGRNAADGTGPRPGAVVSPGEGVVADASGRRLRGPREGEVEQPRRAEAVGAGDCSAWAGADWITGHDGKARRVEPGIRLLAHGVPARVGRLRAYGNAIVPQEAAQVIGAYLDMEAGEWADQPLEAAA